MTYSDKFNLLPTIGKNITEARLINDITTEELAALVGLSERSIISIENGLRGTTIENYAKLADILGISIDEIVGKPNRRQAAGLSEPSLKINKLLHICKNLSDEQADLVINVISGLKTYTKGLEAKYSADDKRPD